MKTVKSLRYEPTKDCCIQVYVRKCIVDEDLLVAMLQLHSFLLRNRYASFFVVRFSCCCVIKHISFLP